MSDRRSGPGFALAILGAVGLAATVASLAGRLPPSLWATALFSPRSDDVAQLLVHYSLLPRAAVALIAGASLALAGGVFQQTLRNPLASPSTLGVSAGAQLALSLATLAAPDLVAASRDLVAIAGATMAAAVVFLLSWRSRFSPLTVILAGMVTGMFCGAAASVLVLFNDRMLTGMLIWGSGSLNQQDWSVAAELAPRALLAVICVALLARPLALLDLDSQAKSVGLRVVELRLACLGVAVALTAAVVSAIGVVGFVGLAAPAFARALGARRPAPRLAWGTGLGAGLLFATDSILQAIEIWTGVSIPAGAATALIGAPTLLWLAPRLKTSPQPETAHAAASGPGARNLSGLALLAVALPLAGLASLAVGRSPDGGLAFASGQDFAQLLRWRWPRTLAAAAAGAMLACAGVMLQRLTRNPIASPEVLGVSSGAALGMVAALMLLAAPGYGIQVAAATSGALLVAAMLLAVGRGGAGGSDHLLLAGIALGAGVNAVLAMLMAGGDPKMLLLANWMAGSAYDVEPPVAIAAAALAAVGLGASALVTRWLALAPLGNAAMASVGVSPKRATLAILALASGMTAAATMAIGPLSFAGLIGPHIASRLGFSGAGRQLAAAAMIGGLVMLAADWIGRVVYFPFQTPAGLVGMAIAGPLMMWLLQAGRR